MQLLGLAVDSLLYKFYNSGHYYFILFIWSTGSPFIPYIIQNGFDERHAYIGGMFGAGKKLD